MNDLQVGDSVFCEIEDEINRIGTIVKIRPPDVVKPLYFVQVPDDDMTTTISFYRHKLTKTYNINDIDNQIKAMEIL